MSGRKRLMSKKPEDKRTDETTSILKREYTGIENRSDLSDDQKVSRIIKITASVCAAVAIQPIPFADIFILTPIQAYMGTRIAAVRGVSVTQKDMLTYIKEIAGVIGLGMFAQQFAIGAYKLGLPFLGGFMTLPLVYGLTYGIGRVIDVYMVRKAKGQSVDPKILKKIWKEGRKEGKKATDKASAEKHAKEMSLSNKDE